MQSTEVSAEHSAAQHFAGIAELLVTLGELVAHDRSLLWKLCLVSRSFNDIFTPFLYRAVLLTESKWRPGSDGESSPLSQLENVANTREIDIRFSKRQFDYYREDPPFHDFVSRLLPNMKKVQVVRLQGVTVAHKCINDAIAHLNPTELYIDFYCSLVRNSRGRCPRLMRPQLTELPPGNHFDALRRLTFEEIDIQQQDCSEAFISSIMANAPKLEHLRLSMGGGECRNIFERICGQYSRCTGGSLIPLKSISFGKSIHIPPKDVLGGCINLSTLEEVQIAADCKCYIQHGPSWTQFNATNTPNMSRLEILRMYAANWRYLPPLLQGKTGFKAKRFDWDHRGPQHPVKQMAQLARVPMLQIPLGCSPEGVPHLLAGLDACDWLTHLKLSIAAEGLCGLMSNGAWRCWLPDLCKAALHLPNLVALEVAPDRDGGGWSNCHGKKELARAAEELMAACPGLEYVELERVAYGADCQEGVGRETERTWKKLTETDKELRRPPFFVQD